MYTGVSVGSIETITIAQNSTKFSQTIARFDKCAGFAGAFITISAGSLTISQQCGFKEGELFYDPKDKNNNSLGVVCSLFAAGTYYIQYDPVVAPFIRWKFVEANIGSATITFLPFLLEDR